MRTDTMRIPIIDGELDTTAELRAPWLLPPVTARYARRSAWRRFARSGFVRDVTCGVADLGAILGGCVAGYVLLLVLLHVFAPWVVSR